MDDTRRICMVETETTASPSAVTRYRYQYGDHLGTAALEADEDGRVITYEEFHPYGSTAWWAEKSGIEVSRKRYRYTGMEKDEETGLSYHNARYYMTWLGRWDKADPIGLGDGLNRFAYVGDNPIRLFDIKGKDGRDPSKKYIDPIVERSMLDSSKHDKPKTNMPDNSRTSANGFSLKLIQSRASAFDSSGKEIYEFRQHTAILINQAGEEFKAEVGEFIPGLGLISDFQRTQEIIPVGRYGRTIRSYDSIRVEPVNGDSFILVNIGKPGPSEGTEESSERNLNQMPRLKRFEEPWSDALSFEATDPEYSVQRRQEILSEYEQISNLYEQESGQSLDEAIGLLESAMINEGYAVSGRPELVTSNRGEPILFQSGFSNETGFPSPGVGRLYPSGDIEITEELTSQQNLWHPELTGWGN